jgi:hypothetical protein
MSTSDKIALISLVVSSVTAMCAIFLSYEALVHSARPRLSLKMLTSSSLHCGVESTHIFAVENAGHWYASPMAVDVMVYCNFDPAFQLQRMRYGSIQEHVNTKVKSGVGDMKYLKAKGLKVSKREEGEHIHVVAIAPTLPGKYIIRLTASSANGASLTKEFPVTCQR